MTCEHDFIFKSSKGVWCYDCKTYLTTEQKENRSIFSPKQIDEMNRQLQDECNMALDLVPNKFKSMQSIGRNALNNKILG